MLYKNYTAIHTDYTTWLNTLGFSKGTVHDCKKHTATFFKWLHTQDVNHINTLNQKHIQTYDYLQIRPNSHRQGTLSVAQLNHAFTAIDKLCEFLHQMGMSQAPSPTNYRMRVDKQARINNIHPFTQGEIKTLQACISGTFSHLPFALREAKHEQLKLIFALYYGCGLRRMEGYRLTVNDVDFDRKTIFIKQGKGYKDRIIPMSAGVYKTLQEYIYNFRYRLKLPHKRLFIDNDLAIAESLKHLKNACNDEAIKNKRLTLHLLRHSIATHLLQNGMSVENIALFLGHTSLASTQVYTHVANQQ
jgi:integrase/recombinase XerD